MYDVCQKMSIPKFKHKMQTRHLQSQKFTLAFIKTRRIFMTQTDEKIGQIPEFLRILKR